MCGDLPTTSVFPCRGLTSIARASPVLLLRWLNKDALQRTLNIKPISSGRPQDRGRSEESLTPSGSECSVKRGHASIEGLGTPHGVLDGDADGVPGCRRPDVGCLGHLHGSQRGGRASRFVVRPARPLHLHAGGSESRPGRGPSHHGPPPVDHATRGSRLRPCNFGPFSFRTFPRPSTSSPASVAAVPWRSFGFLRELEERERSLRRGGEP